MTYIQRIASALAQHPDIAEAEVVSVQVDEGERLLAVVTLSGFVTGPVLRECMWQDAGDAEAPVGLLILERIPRRDGKTDAEAVGSLAQKAGAGVWFHAPADVFESQLASIWTDALRLTRVSVLDSFLDLGGNSLAAIRIVAEVESRFQISLGLDELLDASVRSMADVVRLRQAGRVSGEAG